MIGATYGFWLAPASMPWAAAGCFLLMGLMVYVPQMLIAAMAMNLGTQRASAAAVGLTGIFAYSSTVLSGWGIGKIVDTAGWNGAFQMLIGCAVVTAALMALTWNVGAHAETTHPLSPVPRGEAGLRGAGSHLKPQTSSL